MNKSFELSTESAKELYGKNPELDIILKQYFTDEELGVKKNFPKTYAELIDRYLNRSIDTLTTPKQTQSAIAYSQLIQLIYAYNNEWEPNWIDKKQPKYCIIPYENKLRKEVLIYSTVPLAFETAEIRDEFLNNFEELIKTFYQIEEN